MNSFNHKHILITGASSGIGKALAIALSSSRTILYLNGRNLKRLEDTAKKCREKGATVYTKIIDISQKEAMKQWILSLKQLDLVFACAGVSASMLNPTRNPFFIEDETIIYPMIETNLIGTLNTILPAIELMNKQTIGQNGIKGKIAVIASIAAFFPSPWAPSYCSSKSAIDYFTVAYAEHLYKSGIILSSVCCGFITTPLTDKNHFMMPGILSTHQAAKKILIGLSKNKRRIIFPVWLGILTKIFNLFPIYISQKIIMLILNYFKQTYR